MADPCNDEEFYSNHKEFCDESEREEEDDEPRNPEFGLGLYPKRIDPISQITQHKMFPLLLIGGLAAGAYFLFFKKGKFKL